MSVLHWVVVGLSFCLGVAVGAGAVVMYIVRIVKKSIKSAAQAQLAQVLSQMRKQGETAQQRGE